MVAARAPDGFDRIEDVLDAGELGTLRDAYRATSQEDVAALNSRPPTFSQFHRVHKVSNLYA